jgi:ABC-2 type transport system ATP-binding protein
LIHVQSTDHRITAELKCDDSIVSELMSQLVQGGVRLRSFHDKDPTLEDVFMMVTKGLVT